MQPIAPETGELTDWLAQHVGKLPGVRAVTIFGSTARGDRQPRSDIDIAIDFDGSPQQWADVQDVIEMLPTLLPLDVVRLDLCDEELKDEISREGVPGRARLGA